MAKILLARGAQGELVRKAQGRLRDAGFDPRAVDGVYGSHTAEAVQRLQRAHGMPPTGAMDANDWRVLMGTPPPGVRELALQVTAAFEGHGFGFAQGNWDGAGITWGIVGFTLKHGGLARIVLRIHDDNPALLHEVFGARTEELLGVLGTPVVEQLAWADRISVGQGKTGLAEPWGAAFSRFGRFPEVQAVQLEFADRGYFQPASTTARHLGLRTELGLALAFDIHVQNGGLGERARREIEQRRRERPLSRERELRVIVSHAVAANARPEYREDVRSRKLTLALGHGHVHGSFFSLRDWGLDESEAAPTSISESNEGNNVQSGACGP